MRTVLIDVDTQHDFCDPAGALYVRGAEKLAPAFRALVARALETKAPIVGSVDSHAFDAWEFAGAEARGPNGEQPNFPPHCVKGTPGWLKVPGTLPVQSRFIPNVVVGERELHAMIDTPRALMLEKEVYSLFANPNAEAVLGHLAATRYVVFGVATDYCVRAAVLGLRKYAPHAETFLVTDAIAAVDAAGGTRAIEECAQAGARLVTVSDAMGVLS
jgi:nicotinamidase/pyrazinamidase